MGNLKEFRKTYAIPIKNMRELGASDKEVAKGLDIAGGRSIFPHASGQYGKESWQKAQAQKHGHTDHEVVALADGEGMVLEGDKATLLT